MIALAPRVGSLSLRQAIDLPVETGRAHSHRAMS